MCCFLFLKLFKPFSRFSGKKNGQVVSFSFPGLLTPARKRWGFLQDNLIQRHATGANNIPDDALIKWTTSRNMCQGEVSVAGVVSTHKKRKKQRSYVALS